MNFAVHGARFERQNYGHSAKKAARQLLRRALAFFAVVILVAASVRRAHASVISSAKILKQNETVELRFKVDGRGLNWHLAGNGQELRISLEHTRLAIAPRPLYGQEEPPVTRVRAIDSGAGSAQLIIEVSGKVDYAVARAGHELVIRFALAGTVNDLAAPLMVELKRKRYLAAAIVSAPLTLPRSDSISTASRPTAPALIADQSSLPKVAPANAAAASPPTDFGQRDYVPSGRLRPVAIIPPPPLSKRPLVMIDPGHGGRDPGTEAAGVVGEKDVALQIAQYLRQTLELRGVDAQLTRGDDTFLSLGERTQLANNAHADLFISIHLNSNPDMNLAGIETYYLNNSSDRATIRLARMENGVAGGYGAPRNPDLNYILTDLRQGYKANESASLARMIESESVAGVDSSLGLRVNALGAKKGPFYVLVGAEMPSVLVECGFLSNPGEARLLSESRYQRALADGIAVAVMDYFNASAAVGNL